MLDDELRHRQLTAATQMVDAVIDVYDPDMKFHDKYELWQRCTLELAGGMIGLYNIVSEYAGYSEEVLQVMLIDNMLHNKCRQCVDRLKGVAVGIDFILEEAGLATRTTHAFKNAADSGIGMILDTLRLRERSNVQ